MPAIDHPPDAVINSLTDLVSSSFLNHDPNAIHIRAGALFARLKALNRTANAATRTHKQATADARHDMDQTHLSLQNFQYQKRHLQREIEKCRQFAAIYQDIPLYSMEEFLERAPPESRTQDTVVDDHTLMLNRLSFELSERQRLEKKQKELVQNKELLLKQSKSQAATMDSVKSQIEVLIKAATEAQKKVTDLASSAPAPESTPGA